MLRLLITTLLNILGSTIGLIVASLFIAGFNISLQGFVVSVLFFTIAQGILGPFVLKMAIKYAPAFRGGIALITVLASLIITVVFTDGLSITGLSAWVLAPLVVWLGAVISSIVLPLFMFKKILGNKSSRSNSKTDIRNIIQ